MTDSNRKLFDKSERLIVALSEFLQTLQDLQGVPLPPAPVKYYTSRELCERLRLHNSVLANWRIAGKGPKFVKVGRKVLYVESDVLAWEKQQTKRSTVE